MTTTQRLKDELNEYLLEMRPSASLSVVDSKQRAEVNLPTLAVEVSGVEPHSSVLPHVQRCQLTFKLRTHAGDESDYDIDSWIDQIESLLNDPSSIKQVVDETVQIDYWIYNGSSQEWDESILEVNFEAECLCCRI